MKRVDDFRQRQPGDGVPVSRKTSAWIAYDDRNFYVVFVCESPAGQTRARLAKREDVMSDDLVGVFFDTYRSGQRGYEFFVNPLGVQADAALAEGQNDDFSFDTLWYSEGKITPEGYVAMLSIPFRSLRFASQTVQTWGFKRATFDLSYATGTRINYTPASGVAPFLANGNDLQAGFTLRPVARLKIDEIYYLTRLRTAQASVLVNHLTRTRINYQFTRELSLRVIMDYNAVLENAALIDLTRQKRITGDALLTYLIHPGTALYVGYTDQLGNLGLIDGMVRPIPFPSTTTARQFFAKISYLFRF